MPFEISKWSIKMICDAAELSISAHLLTGDKQTNAFKLSAVSILNHCKQKPPTDACSRYSVRLMTAVHPWLVCSVMCNNAFTARTWSFALLHNNVNINKQKYVSLSSRNSGQGPLGGGSED